MLRLQISGSYTGYHLGIHTSPLVHLKSRESMQHFFQRLENSSVRSHLGPFQAVFGLETAVERRR